ncbi:MAG TPA: antibiotic biosynthesis monooxygenase [Candidatus Acidoferrales bacterium]|nr:antibiotic biosynthesis monooxygenase [Candidatus Acidoferrales bacterium]
MLSTDDSGNANLVLCARVRPDKESEFAHWHVRWQTAVLAAPGALSFEYRPPAPPDQEEAIALATFDSTDSLRRWRHGDECRALIAQAVPLVEGGIVMQLAGQAAAGYIPQHSATELIVTQIKPGMEQAYRAFAERIQKAQEAFPGYVGSFVQPPHQKEPGWTTVIRFDTEENLENWLNSPRRAALIEESEDLTQGFAAQRVDTSFPGWVPTDPATGKPPSIWKTACLVLLTLFPVVVLELKFLTPHLRTLNPALGTFVGNAISVALTTWPLMPLAVRAFHRWLFPENQPRWLVLTSPIVLLCCYALEIALLWRLL